MFKKLKKIFQLKPTILKQEDRKKSQTPLHPPESMSASKQDISYTKTGIRKINPNEDLYQLFKADDHEEKEKKHLRSVKATQNRHPKELPRDKHGFTILDNKHDYLAAFKDDKPELHRADVSQIARVSSYESDENFSMLLDKSLKGKTVEEMLAEKKDIYDKKKLLSRKQRLNMYPSPQAQIDLHGFTAVKAEQKANSFIRNAYMRGTKTLLIIVGKGLHSQEGRAVLPDVVEDLLIRLKQENIVFAYEWENRKKSKSGAVIIYLEA